MSVQRSGATAAQALCAEGVGLHRQGRLDEARRAYDRALKLDPRHFDALHLRGVVCLQTQQPSQAITFLKRAIAINPRNAAVHGLLAKALDDLKRPADAVKIYDQAIALDPTAVDVWYNRALSLQALNRVEAAVASYDKAIGLQPGFVQAHYNRGVLLQASHRPDEAVGSYDRAIALVPTLVEPHLNRALALVDLNRLDQALAGFDQVIALNPGLADAHLNRGLTLHKLSRAADALPSFDRAITLQPDLADAYLDRGLSLQALKRHEEALNDFDRAIALSPHHPEAHINRCVSLWALHRLDEALASADRAISLAPADARAHNNRGSTLHELDRLDEALASFDHALALRPDSLDAHGNRGAVLRELNRLPEALSSFDSAIAADANYPEAWFNKSMILLALGSYEQGWPLYEWRHRMGALNRALDQPLWLGEAPLEGKTILLQGEQGLGDTLQFCRYAKLVAERGARVILEAQKPLLTLLDDLDGVDRAIAPDEDPGDFDYRCPLMSLPLAFKTRLSTIPWSGPYIRANAEKALTWRHRFGGSTKPKVGLVWNGGLRAQERDTWRVNARRNIAFEALAGVNIPAVDFYSLQIGAEAEADMRSKRSVVWRDANFFDFTPEIKDFSDTAALIENLDLVISVDTSTAHLAAAMGKPVWILSRFDSCWRWLLDREDSPWYPTARVFRQPQMGDWAPVIDRVRAELANVTPGRPDDRSWD